MRLESENGRWLLGALVDHCKIGRFAKLRTFDGGYSGLRTYIEKASRLLATVLYDVE